MRLLLKIIYDGTAYAGYQAQPDVPSIQGALTEAISSALGMKCSVTGCSRTDAGVHALGFVAAVEPVGNHADDWLLIPVGRVHRAAARYLPCDISICGEALVDDDFHPRYSVKLKEYLYRMYDTPYADPFLTHRAWHLKRQITDEGIARMNRCAELIVGRRDFSSFMASGSKIVNAVREVCSLTVERRGDFIELRISADGFLYNMVRIITGTLIDCAYGTIEPCDITGIIEAKDRTRAGRTAPPEGLYLANVKYGREIGWEIY